MQKATQYFLFQLIFSLSHLLLQRYTSGLNKLIVIRTEQKKTDFKNLTNKYNNYLHTLPIEKIAYYHSILVLLSYFKSFVNLFCNRYFCYTLILIQAVNIARKYNQNMDINFRQQNFLEQPSFSFQFFKPSPCLTPMLITDINNSYEHNFDQLNNSHQQLRNQIIEPQIQQSQQNCLRISDQVQQKHEVNLDSEDTNPQILFIIKLLIENTNNPQQQLSNRAAQIAGGSKRLMEIFKILSKKFKKLKKTKQQMTKYCMRKAFKTISDRNRNLTTREKATSNTSFSSGKISKPNISMNSILKKINTQKTMNGSFLKKIFSQEGFLEDYNYFLEKFDELITEDNDQKIKYLAKTVNQFLKSNNIKKIEGIKRLPWTRDILLKTEELSRQLPRYADPGFVLLSRKKC